MMPTHKTITKRVAVTTVYELKLNREEIVQLLRAAGYPVSDDVRVSVRVPGGGDWSNIDLTIGTDVTQVSIDWSTHEHIV